MEPWMVIAGGVVTAIAGYLTALARNRTDVSLARHSREMSENERLHSAFALAQDKLNEFYQQQLDYERKEAARLRAENERLWRELKEAVDAGHEIVRLHQEQADTP